MLEGHGSTRSQKPVRLAVGLLVLVVEGGSTSRTGEKGIDANFAHLEYLQRTGSGVHCRYS